MKSEAINKLAEDVFRNEQHLVGFTERIRKVGVVRNKVAMNDRQLRLFTDELDRVGRAAERTVEAMKHFVLHGAVKKLEQQQRDQRRYRWHKALKERGIDVDGPAREIDVSEFASFEDIPVGTRWYVGQLIKIGYNAKYRLL